MNNNTSPTMIAVANVFKPMPEAGLKRFFKEDRQPSKIREIDPSRIVLVNPLKEGETSINGEERLRRLNDGAATLLGVDHLLACWSYYRKPTKIPGICTSEFPEEWKPFIVTFDLEDDVLVYAEGTYDSKKHVVVYSDGPRCVRAIYCCDNRWWIQGVLLNEDLDDRYRSATLQQ